MNTFTLIRSDLSRFTAPRLCHHEITVTLWQIFRSAVPQQGAWAAVEFRIRQRIRRVRGPVAPLLRLVAFFTKRTSEILTGISLSNDAEFGPGLYIGHFGGIVVGAARVGADANLSQGVTLGAHRGASPMIGDAVYIAPGAKVFGGITVGDHAVIGANAVVRKDVASNTTVGGVPAKLLSDTGREQW